MKTTSGQILMLAGLLTAAASHADLTLVEDFNDIPTGAVTNDADWSIVDLGNAVSFNVVDTPPASPGNHALINTPTSSGVKNSTLGSIQEVANGTNNVGTLFFRVNLSSLSTGTSIGLGRAGISDFSEYRTQIAFNQSSTNTFAVLDGTTSKYVNNVSLVTNTWYSFWVVANNASNTWTAYVQGGSIAAATKVAVSGDDSFNFRNTGGGDLDTVMISRGSGGSPNTVRIDDIYFGLGDQSGVDPFAAVPEPSVIGLIAAGTALLSGFRRFRFNPDSRDRRQV